MSWSKETIEKMRADGAKMPGEGAGVLEYTKVDLSGKVAIVTGANSGIGYYTVRDLALMGARVIMACRSPAKAKTAMDDLKKEIGAEKCKLVEFMALDLASLQSVMDFVEEFKKKGYPLHLLICNGGAWFNEKGITKDGFEQSFQVNYLSHFLLTLHLLPVMRNSGKDCRIINVSSMGHAGGSFDLENIQAQKEFHMFFYANSKLFQVMNMYSLQKRLEGSNVRVYSLNPGGVNTPILGTLRKANEVVDNLVKEQFEKGTILTPEQGAMTTLLLSTSQLDKGGLYYSECALMEPHPKAKNEEDQEKLWKYSLEQLKKYTNAEILKGLA